MRRMAYQHASTDEINPSPSKRGECPAPNVNSWLPRALRVGASVVCVQMVCCLFLAFDTVPMRADSYRYHPDSSLALGRGFDPHEPGRTFEPCVLQPREWVEHLDTGGPPSTTYETSVVNSRADLYKKLNIDVGLSANFAFGSASASTNIDDQLTFSQDSLVWILKASTDYGRWTLRHTRLQPWAAKLDAASFSSRCGSEVVVQVRRVAQIAAVFSLTATANTHSQKVIADIKGAYGNFSGHASIESIVNEAMKVSTVSVSVIATGGEGLVRLADLSLTGEIDGADAAASAGKKLGTLNDVQKTIGRYIAQMDEKRATAVEFKTLPYVGRVAQSFDDTKGQTLPELYFQYLDARAAYSALGAAVRRPSAESTESDWQSTRQKYVAAGKLMKDIRCVANSCMKENMKAVCDVTVGEAAIPLTGAERHSNAAADIRAPLVNERREYLDSPESNAKVIGCKVFVPGFEITKAMMTEVRNEWRTTDDDNTPLTVEFDVTVPEDPIKTNVGHSMAFAGAFRAGGKDIAIAGAPTPTKIGACSHDYFVGTPFVGPEYVWEGSRQNTDGPCTYRFVLPVKVARKVSTLTGQEVKK